jgi:hypothetical protein
MTRPHLFLDHGIIDGSDRGTWLRKLSNVICIDAGKTFDKIQHLLMVSTLNMVRVAGMDVNITKIHGAHDI